MAGFGAALTTMPVEKAGNIPPDSSDSPSPTQALLILQKQNEHLRLSLSQTETLMRENNHRAKNNLQIVSSLLQLQADSLNDPAAVAALKATQTRVFSMALLHEQLCGDTQIDRIDFEDYVRALLKELLDSYAGPLARTRLCVNSSKVFLNTDQATACGLILNELVTNALKYAYPADAEGEVTVELREAPEGVVTLSVADKGLGLPDGFDWRNSSTMGLLIVDLLTKQIGATMRVETHPGATFKIEFRK